MKPDDIPQWAWDEADRVGEECYGETATSPRSVVARALLSARQQGRDEGLEEAAKVVEVESVMAHSGAVHPTGKAHAAVIREKIGEHGNG